MAQKKLVKVTIYDAEYTVAGEADEKYIRELAEFVDERMKKIGKETGIPWPMQVAVLTAFNIADDLLKVKNREGERRQNLSKKVDELTKVVDNAIKTYGT